MVEYFNANVDIGNRGNSVAKISLYACSGSTPSTCESTPIPGYDNVLWSSDLFSPHIQTTPNFAITGITTFITNLILYKHTYIRVVTTSGYTDSCTSSEMIPISGIPTPTPTPTVTPTPTPTATPTVTPTPTATPIPPTPTPIPPTPTPIPPTPTPIHYYYQGVTCNGSTTDYFYSLTDLGDSPGVIYAFSAILGMNKCFSGVTRTSTTSTNTITQTYSDCNTCTGGGSGLTPLSLAYDSSSHATACSNYATHTDHYYIQGNASLQPGNTLCQNDDCSNKAPDGYYSNGTNWWGVSGNGYITTGGSCNAVELTTIDLGGLNCRLVGSCNDDGTCSVRYNIYFAHGRPSATQVYLELFGSNTANVSINNDLGDNTDVYLDYSETSGSQSVNFRLVLKSFPSGTEICRSGDLTLNHNHGGAPWYMISTCSGSSGTSGSSGSSGSSGQTSYPYSLGYGSDIITSCAATATTLYSSSNLLGVNDKLYTTSNLISANEVSTGYYSDGISAYTYTNGSGIQNWSSCNSNCESWSVTNSDPDNDDTIYYTRCDGVSDLINIGGGGSTNICIMSGTSNTLHSDHGFLNWTNNETYCSG
jgi:hypothetical protein